MSDGMDLLCPEIAAMRMEMEIAALQRELLRRKLEKILGRWYR